MKTGFNNIKSVSSFDRTLNALLLIAVGAGVLGLIYVAARYLGFMGFLDHMESHVALLSWEFLNGQGLFRPVDAPDYRINSYGPGLFLIEAFFYDLLGPSLLTSKLPSTIGLLGATALFCLYAYKRFGLFGLGFAGTAYVGLVLKFAPASYWNRPEGVLIFAVVMAILVVNWRRETLFASKAILFGGLVGFATALKLYGFLYFVSIAWPLLLTQATPRRIVGMALLSIASACGAFLLTFAHSGIDLATFLDNLVSMAGVRTRNLGQFAHLAKSAAYFALPVFVVGMLFIGRRLALPTSLKIEFVVFLAVFAALFYPASMPGAGAYYFLPFAAVVADLSLRFLKTQEAPPPTVKGLATLFAIVVLVLSVPQQRRQLRAMSNNLGPLGYSDIQDIVERYPGVSVNMGFGGRFETYHLSYLAPVLSFSGLGGAADAATMMELRASGRADRLVDLEPDLSPCVGKIWLIPKDERPFSLESYYDGQPLFSTVFTDEFKTEYKKIGSKKAFDIWTCSEQ